MKDRAIISKLSVEERSFLLYSLEIMPRTLYLFFFLVFLSLSRISLGEIIPTDTLEPLEKELSHLDSNSLVLFDVDNTLICPKDLLLRAGGKYLRKKFSEEVLSSPSIRYKYPRHYLFYKVLLTHKPAVIDSKSLSILDFLQKNHIPAIILTAADSGKRGPIQSLADWRIQELKELGFDFSQAFPEFFFLQLSQRLPSIIFKSGILFSSGQSKGKTLKAFLNKISWKPTKVLFIDDHISQLRSVERFLQKEKITFIGFHYKAEKKLPCKVDREVAKTQFAHLVDHGEWLSDEQATLLLQEQRKQNIKIERFRPRIPSEK